MRPLLVEIGAAVREGLQRGVVRMARGNRLDRGDARFSIAIKQVERLP